MRRNTLFWLVVVFLSLALAAGASEPAPGTISSNPKDLADMVYVPAGWFYMGSSKGGSDELPVHTVYLSGFWIYKTEVTVGQYKAFCQATGKQMPREPKWGWGDSLPMTGVSWYDALAYAKWAGGRLPTEAEWEKAARGTDGRQYPWGNDDDRSRYADGSVGAEAPLPVGSYPTGAGPYGCLDMAGGVYEWCVDWYDKDYYKVSPEQDPAGPESSPDNYRVTRSRDWKQVSSTTARCARRWRSSPGSTYDGYGFRVVVGGAPIKITGETPPARTPTTMPVKPTPPRVITPVKPVIPSKGNYLEGKVVYNEKGLGAIVLTAVTDKFATTKYKATSASDGTYKLGPIPDGSYRVYARCGDNPRYFNRFTNGFAVKGGQTRTMPSLEMGMVIDPISPKPGSAVDLGSGVRLSWTPCEGAVKYRLTVTNVETKKTVAMAYQTAPQGLIRNEFLLRGETYRVSITALNQRNRMVGGTAGCGRELWTFKVQ